MAHEGQLTELVSHVHTISNDKFIGAGETLEVRSNMSRKVAGLIQEHGRVCALRTTGRKKILGKRKGSSRFENVVDQQNIPSPDIRFNVTQDVDLPRRFR